MDKLKIMFLGFSGAGKTYLQGSFYKLAFSVGSKAISLQPLKFAEKNRITDVGEIISKANQNSPIPSNMGISTTEMVLKKGVAKLFEIYITDIEGQAIAQGGNVKVAQEILNTIPNYDGLILVIEYPTDEAKLEKVKQELFQLLNFAGEALEKNPKIPLTLASSARSLTLYFSKKHPLKSV